MPSKTMGVSRESLTRLFNFLDTVAEESDKDPNNTPTLDSLIEVFVNMSKKDSKRPWTENEEELYKAGWMDGFRCCLHFIMEEVEDDDAATDANGTDGGRPAPDPDAGG